MASPEEPRVRRPRGGRTQPMRIDATLRTDDDALVVVVAGDVDADAVEQLREVVTMGLGLVARTVVRLDGVTVFGSGASRVIRDLLASADVRGNDLRIEGVPDHVAEVFAIVGLEDDRISSCNDSAQELPPVIFDSVVAAGAMRTRESVCITTADPTDPCIVFVNDAFTALTGYQSDDVLGKNPKFLQGPLTERAVLDRLKRNLRDNRDFSGEAVNYRADGSPFWMNWRILPIEYGAHRYFMAMQRDNTRLRQLSRLDAARNRLSRSINRSGGNADRQMIIEALGVAATALITPPEAIVTTALMDRDGDVVAANLEGSVIDAAVLSSAQPVAFDREGAAAIHVPFRVNDQFAGHLLVQELHPDWVQLIDIGQLKQLCDDCVVGLINAD